MFDFNHPEENATKLRMSGFDIENLTPHGLSLWTDPATGDDIRPNKNKHTKSNNYGGFIGMCLIFRIFFSKFSNLIFFFSILNLFFIV